MPKMIRHFFIIGFMVSGCAGIAQCYFSPGGDTVLLQESLYIDTDSVPYKHALECILFTRNAEGRFIREKELKHFAYTDSADYKDLPPHLSHFTSGEAQKLYYNQVNSEIKIKLHIQNINLIEKVRGGCSKGCGWKVHYRMKVKFRLLIHGQTVWAEHFDPLYYTLHESTEWGERPPRRGRIYLAVFPDEVMEVQLYKSETSDLIFMYFRYSTSPPEANSWQEKFYFIENFL